MSKISKTSANIKKKLTFGDYSKPAHQDTVIEPQLQAGAPVGQQTIMTVEPQVSEPVKQQDIMPEIQNDSIPVQQHTDTLEKQHTGLKIKATYYLGHEELTMVTELFIDRLRTKTKADRSSIICAAIRLLYLKEKGS